MTTIEVGVRFVGEFGPDRRVTVERRNALTGSGPSLAGIDTGASKDNAAILDDHFGLVLQSGLRKQWFRNDHALGIAHFAD